jgi:hypothetical protein
MDAAGSALPQGGQEPKTAQQAAPEAAFNADGAAELTEEDYGYNIPQSEYVPLSFEEKVEHACHLLLANSLNRPSLYQILKACSTGRWLLADLEQHIQERPEFSTATQPPYFLVQWLVDAHALDEFDLDAAGEVLEPQRFEGLSEDEIDDLIEDFAFETNEVGAEVLERFSPKHRLMELLDIVPERYDTYIEVLGFLEQKRPFAEVDALLRGREILRSGREPGEPPMQPSVFIDKLAAAGGAVWSDGWQITEEGKELLETIRERSS